MHRRSVGGPGGARAPPKFYRLQFGGARAPPKFYRMVIEGRFEHNEIKVKIGENYQKSKLNIQISHKFIKNIKIFSSFLKYFYILSLRTLRFLKNYIICDQF